MPETHHTSTMTSSHHDRLAKQVQLDSKRDQSRGESTDEKKPPTTREIVEMFQNAVDTARDDHPKTPKTETHGENIAPKLTAVLKNKRLVSIPKVAIPIIRQDVERLQLAKNELTHLPYEFTQCSVLKYLNLRDNNFEEIPKALFSLPQLEIIDLSRNKLTEVPVEIEQIKALRVFSVQQNKIRDLPYCLGNINTLRMLKILGNPLNASLQRIVDGSEFSPSPSPVLMKDEDERDRILTKKLTEYMRYQAARLDSGEDSTSDGALETPRAAFSRFPVQPHSGHSTSGSESASDLRSPGFRPSLPGRSHTRAPSTQYGTLQNAAPRRPGLAPLALGNERNRSNSESVLQSTQNTKIKRMGVVTRKYNGLGAVDESRTNRNSFHLRGQSHGSALRSGMRTGDGSSSSGIGEEERLQGIFTRRLVSLPEQKQELRLPDHLIDCSKAVLFSLDAILPKIMILALVVKDGRTKRSSMERDFYSAGMHIEHLDQQLVRFNDKPKLHRERKKGLRSAIIQSTRECAVVQKRLTAILADIAGDLIKQVESIQVRALMLTTYGSTVELFNTRKELMATLTKVMPPKHSIQRVSTINEAPNEGDHTYVSDRSTTPTQHRKPERRWKSGSVTQQTIDHPNLSTPVAQTAVPYYPTARSRSNSRATRFNSSTSSSVVTTPRSGESFNSAFLGARSRGGSVNITSEQLRTEKEERAQFEDIYSSLKASIEVCLSIIPHLDTEFSQALYYSGEQQVPHSIRDQWSILAASTTRFLETTESLRIGLTSVRLNDRETLNGQDFWQLVKSFLDSYSDLMLAVKKAVNLNLVDGNIKFHLRPLHTPAKETAKLIAVSPWNYLVYGMDPQATPQTHPQRQVQPPAHQNGYQHRTRGSGGSSTGGSSPYPSNVPATPLSAALGPAAQATVPAAMTNLSQAPTVPLTPAGTMPPTPGTASFERSFEGDIFQRADTLQSLQQTMIPRRHAL